MGATSAAVSLEFLHIHIESGSQRPVCGLRFPESRHRSYDASSLGRPYVAFLNGALLGGRIYEFYFPQINNLERQTPVTKPGTANQQGTQKIRVLLKSCESTR